MPPASVQTENVWSTAAGRAAQEGNWKTETQEVIYLPLHPCDPDYQMIRERNPSWDTHSLFISHYIELKAPDLNLKTQNNMI